MKIPEYVLWCSLIIGIYTWIGYPVLLHFLVIMKSIYAGGNKNDDNSLQVLPRVSFIITVRNAEAVIARKIENSLHLDYPMGKLQILVASDGSTDRTVEIANEISCQYDNVEVYDQQEHRGKTTTQNEAVTAASGEIIVFTDVDTIFDNQCLIVMVRNFANPQVGCVAGQMAWTNESESNIAQAAGLYWRLEKTLWTYESLLNIMAWAPGAAMAVRSSLFKPMNPGYGEDCVVPMDVVEQDCRVVYEPEALAYDSWSSTPAEEFIARQRMTLRSFKGTLSKLSAWHPLVRPALAWSVISHKILRWLTPHFLLVAVISNVFLISQPFYLLVFATQIMFYLAGIVGYFADRYRLHIAMFSTIYSFCLANLAMFIGVMRALLGQKIIAYRSEGFIDA